MHNGDRVSQSQSSTTTPALCRTPRKRPELSSLSTPLPLSTALGRSKNVVAGDDYDTTTCLNSSCRAA